MPLDHHVEEPTGFRVNPNNSFGTTSAICPRIRAAASSPSLCARSGNTSTETATAAPPPRATSNTPSSRVNVSLGYTI